MKKNKKGFTLVELIFCIAIVATITIAATLGLQKVLKRNKANIYKSDLKEILSTTRTYLSVTKAPAYAELQSINLGTLVSSGYISEDIYNKINGLTCNNFTMYTTIYYSYSNGVRSVYLYDSHNNRCDLDFIDDCNVMEDC